MEAGSVNSRLPVRRHRIQDSGSRIEKIFSDHVFEESVHVSDLEKSDLTPSSPNYSILTCVGFIKHFHEPSGSGRRDLL